jgi:hypothetical protein
MSEQEETARHVAHGRQGIGVMEASPTTAAIGAALAKAALSLGSVAKTRRARIESSKGGYGYTYATLADAIDACRDALAGCGIAVVQAPAVGRGVVTVTTTLLHESGEWLSCSLDMPIGEPRAQAVGSAITYARRYSLLPMVGLAADDDDGQEADASVRRAPPPVPRPAPAQQREATTSAAPKASTATAAALLARETIDDGTTADEVRLAADAWASKHARAPQRLRDAVAAYARVRIASLEGREADEEDKYVAAGLRTMASPRATGAEGGAS